MPATPTLLQSVYGWVPPANCTRALVSVPGYDTAIHSYCDLQYNFFDPTVPASDVFNPYVKLVHQSLASNAYAFSIDDAVVRGRSITAYGIDVLITPRTRSTSGASSPAHRRRRVVRRREPHRVRALEGRRSHGARAPAPGIAAPISGA